MLQTHSHTEELDVYQITDASTGEVYDEYDNVKDAIANHGDCIVVKCQKTIDVSVREDCKFYYEEIVNDDGIRYNHQIIAMPATPAM